MSTLAQLLGRTPVSIQRLTVNHTAGDQTLTIAAVDPARTVVLMSPGLSAYGDRLHLYAARLASATQVVISKNGSSSANGGRASIEVVDFGAMVKGVQRGVVNESATSAAIATVAPERCAVIVQVAYDSSASVVARDNAAALTANAITFTANSLARRYWQIVEFW